MQQFSIPANFLVGHLIPLVRQDTQLLGVLQGIAEEFLRLTAAVAPTPNVADIASAEPSLPEPMAPPITLSGHISPRVELPAAFRRRNNAVEIDLQLIEARCRLKADGARWAATRQQRISEGASFSADIEPMDQEIIDNANTIADCYLWMNHSAAPIPSDLRVWEDVAGCFEAAAMAVALLSRVIENGETFRGFLEQVLDLTAEAQSSLRMAVAMVDAEPDNDQQGLFSWLRQAAVEQGIFIARYMRLDDPADPTQWNALQARISQLDSEIDEVSQREERRITLLKRGQYHASLIAKGKKSATDWKKVIEVVDMLISDGVPPSNIELRDMLLPIIDDVPDIELPAGFERVLDAVDRYLTTQSPPVQHVVREPSEEVRKVADLYKDKTMVIIGGDRRQTACEALKSAFCLKDLLWITARRDHDSPADFLPYVSRPEVDVVLLAIRWSRHSFGNVKAMCDRFGKDFYRLPAGYNPNQVAHQILQHSAQQEV